MHSTNVKIKHKKIICNTKHSKKLVLYAGGSEVFLELKHNL